MARPLSERYRGFAVNLLLASTVAAPAGAFANALPGTPLMHSFSADELNASSVHYSVARDGDGRVYSAGSDGGVLVFDGNAWLPVHMPLRKEAQSVASGRDGQVYVTGFNTFGFVRRGDDGQFSYVDLTGQVGLAAAEKQTGLLNEATAMKAGVYFRSDEALYFLSYDHKTLRHWPSTKTVRRLYQSHDRLFAWVKEKGLVTIVDGEQHLVPSGDVFANDAVIGVLPREGWDLVVARNGFYRLAGNALTKLADVIPAADAESAGREAIDLADGSIMVGTSNGLLIEYAPDYTLRNLTQLKANQVEGFLVDGNGGLWVATTGELVRVRRPAPWSFLGQEQGVKEMVIGTAWYDNQLWIAGRGGLQKASSPAPAVTQTVATHWFEDRDTYALKATPAGLLIGEVNGLWVLDPGSQAPRSLYAAEQDLTGQIVLSQFDPHRAYAKTAANLLVLEAVDGRWQLRATLPFESGSTSAILERAKDEIWIADSEAAPARWTLNAAGTEVASRRSFGANDGLKLEEGGNWINQYKGDLYISIGQTVYRYRDGGFTEFKGEPFTLTDHPEKISIVDTKLGAFAQAAGRLWFEPKGSSTWAALDTGNAHEEMNSLELDDDGIVRMGYNGVLQFDPALSSLTRQPLAIKFGGLRAHAPGGSGPPITGEKIPSGSVLDLAFAAVNLGGPVQYRYRILGLLDEWTPWSTEHSIRLKAESPGAYRVQVQARTAMGRTGAAELQYEILPLWYQRTDVRIGIGLVLLGLVALLVKSLIRRRTERYRAYNMALEASVAKRAHELKLVSQELEAVTTQDRLTELPNRRAMDAGLRREWVRCLDLQQPLSAVIVDVDNFKQLTETRGFLEGDGVLRTIAYRLKALCDPDRELLCRYDGDKFLLVMPGTTRDKAQDRAEAIRADLVAHLDNAQSSIGVAAVVPNAGEEPGSLLRKVEAAVVRAKRMGKNRVEVDGSSAAA